MDMKKEFGKLESKAARQRLTMAQVLEKARVSKLTYWRAKEGKYAKHSTTLTVWQKCNAALEERQ